MTVRTSIFMSLDNRVDATSDWQFPWFDGEFFSVLSEEWNRAGVFLIGARSFGGYEQLASDHPDSPMVALLSSKPVVVASRTRTSSSVYPHATFVSDLEPSTVRGIESDHRNVLTLGSAASLVTMVESGALSTLNITVIPTVIGDGPTLFETASRRLTFRTIAARTLGNGILLLDLNVESDTDVS